MLDLVALKPGIGRVTRAIVNSFNFTDVIARGGMAILYREVDATGKMVAVKVAKVDMPHSNFFIENELRTVAHLKHPNLLAYLGRGVQKNGMKYLIMEYFDAKDIGALLLDMPKGIPFDILDALRIIKCAARGLNELHERKLAHADIKPDNILWNRTGVKLVDFALARPEGQMLRVEGKQRYGTDGYLSLDRALRKPPTRKDDLFSLGAMLYEMLAREYAIRREYFADDYKSLREKVENMLVSQPIKELILRMMGESVQGEGFRDCRELVRFIESLERSFASPIYT